MGAGRFVRLGQQGGALLLPPGEDLVMQRASAGSVYP
jgi:hypothetical protein